MSQCTVMGYLQKLLLQNLIAFGILVFTVVGKAIDDTQNRTGNDVSPETAHSKATYLVTTTSTEGHNDKDDRYHMPGYLIGVICLSILFFMVVVYKLYKYISTKELKLPCCPGQQSNRLQRSDTNKPLIRPSVSSNHGGSIYKNQRGSQKA